MFEEYIVLFLCLASYAKPLYCNPALHLDVTPVPICGDDKGSHTVTCTLDATLTSMDKVTSLTIFASRLYGKEGEFDPMVAVDLGANRPEVLNDMITSTMNVDGRIGTGAESTSRLRFSWKAPGNREIGQYKCVANGLDERRRGVSISVKSVVPGSQSKADRTRYFSLLEGLTNSTEELQNNIHDINISTSETKDILRGIEASTAEIKTKVLGIDIFTEEIKGKVRDIDISATEIKSQIHRIDTLERNVLNLQRMVTDLSKSLQGVRNFDSSGIFRGRRYHVSKFVAAFNINASDAECVSLGGYLLELDDKSEFDFVHDFLQQLTGTHFYFTGMNDIDREGVWKFWHSKRHVSFFYWSSGQPDNFGNAGEDCAEIDMRYHAINDLRCNYIGKFICETSA